MFPFSIDGQLEAPKLDSSRAKRLRQRLQAELQKLGAHGIEQEGEWVRFEKRSSPLASRYSALRQIDRGEVEIVPGAPGWIRYRFSCARMLRNNSLLAAVLLAAASLARSEPLVSLAVFLVSWAWLVGVGFLFARIHMRRFLGALLSLS